MSQSKNHSKTLPLTKKSVKSDKNVQSFVASPIAITQLPTKTLTLDDKLWEVSDSFIDQYGLASMHIDSFNCAIEEMIPKIVNEKGKITLVRNGHTHYTEFTNLVFGFPVYKNDSGVVSRSYPKICMDKSLSYASGIYCDIIYKGPNGQYNKYEKKYIGDIYIPVYSNLCNLSKIKGDKYQLSALEEDINDVGGYFILKGSQKVVVPQVRPSHNNIHIYAGKAISTNSKPKFSKYTETRCGGLTSHITTVQVGICVKSTLISVSLPCIDSCSIPIGIVFCALGLKNANEISSFVFEKGWFNKPPSPKHKEAILVLVKSLERSWSILNDETPQQAALHYIGVRSKKTANKSQNQNLSQKDIDIGYEQIVMSAKMLLSTEFLPHIGTAETYSIEKCVFLGYMVRKLLLCHVGLLPISDRDHTANKRIHTSGMIMAAHFYKAFCQLTGKIVSCIDSDIKKNKPVNVASYITQPHIITTSYTTALMSNKWNAGPVQGISQTIDNFNFVATLSFLRKFIIPMANEGGKIEPPRHLHGSQWGSSCVTGDTLVMLADSSLISIRDLDNRPIMSVNPITLKNEPTGTFNDIVIPNSDLLLIEDDEGKTIKCTKDHPFLVYKDGISQFVQAGVLDNSYMLTSTFQNTVFPGEDKIKLPLTDTSIFDSDVLSSGLTNMVSERTAGTIARLMGALYTDGHVSKNQCEFSVGEYEDALNVQRDIFSLGFDGASIQERNTVCNSGTEDGTIKYHTWRISKGGGFYRLMVELGAPIGNKSKQKLNTPMWIMNSTDYVKKEWLCGIQGGDGSRLGMHKRGEMNNRPALCKTTFTCDYDTTEFLQELSDMFLIWGIRTSIVANTSNRIYSLVFKPSKKNLYTYSKTIEYAYCGHKQRASAIIRSYLSHWNYVINNKKLVYEKVRNATGWAETLGVTKSQYYKIRGGKNQKPNYYVDWKEFSKRALENGKYLTKIVSITKLEHKDIVYDFTTISNNHTFIANGFITHNCPYETPEGKKVGLVQILPLGALVTVGCDYHPVIEFLHDMNIVSMSELITKNELGFYDMNDFLSNTRVFVNGIPQGYTRFPQEIVNTLISLRRKCNLNPSISIAHDPIDNEIRISTDAGRSCRGLVTLKNGEITIPEKLLDEMRLHRLGFSNKNTNFTAEKSVWMYLLENGYVELIDKEEEENLNVAIYPSDLASMPISTRIKYTHCEMTPDMIEGVGANTSPKNDCNQAPRNIYQSAMAKQAIGVPGLNHRYHRKSKWHALVYPQKPIINTRIARKVGLDNVPMGQNATVAVMPWYGYNQEDSLVINKNAVDRGFMCSYAYVAHEAVIKHVALPGSIKFETFEIPKKETCNDYRGDPSNLVQHDHWCYVPEGKEVQKGDILIGMTITHASDARYVNSSIYTKKKTNISIIYDQKWPATVHSVLCGKNGDGYMCIKIVTRQYRKPVRGDKFAARHGQKGTVGELVDSKNMPFLTRLGYTPNILLNPLAFPSRMTIGVLIEAVMGISLSASALKCPEYNMPLCLDNSSDEPKSCIKKDFDKDYEYPEGFDPKEDYKMSLDGDASPFVKSFDHNYVLDCIKKLGVPGFCEEEVVNPQTGKKLKSLVFTGIVYYQRLRHMVVDKIHARSTGSHHGLHRQPTEGRKKKGGFRVGHMERDNLTGDSRIFLREGFSVRIATLGKKFENVWGWNAENDGLEKSKQVNFGIGKSRTVYAMTLQDGRVIKGSRHHPFYTEDETYSDMKDLVVDTDRLACSSSGPLVDFEEDMILCKDWIWDSVFFQNIHKEKILPNDYNVFRKSLRLARLMGLISTDGFVSSDKDNALVFPDHLIDVKTVIDDIYSLTGYKPKIKSLEKIRYSVEIPIELSDAVKKMGVIMGKRVKQESYFPDFITENTPLPILREFLGGLFGGDGHTVCISMHREKRDLMKSVSFSWTRDVENLESLQKNMEFLQKLLLRFEIESSIHAPKQTTMSKRSGDRYMHKEIPLVIPLHCLVKFSESIGFRYCEHKSLRLSAGVSYRMFREGVLRQRMWICEKVDDLVDYREKKRNNPKCTVLTKKAIEEAVEELKSKEAILHEKSIPTGKIVGRILTEKNNNELRCEGFPTVEEYLTDIRAIDFFDDQEDTSAKCCIPRKNKFVPTYYLRVIDIRKTDQEEDMYDITVEGNESYVANGVVSHNCMLAQGIPEMVQDRLLYQSDVYKMPMCQVCGLTAIDDGKTTYCRLCQTSKIVNVQLPFGTKLFSQEFSVLNLVPRMLTLPEPT